MNVNRSEEESTGSKDFIRTAVEEDIATNRFDRPIQTRFPPEPNGHLHIGHAKAIALDFGIAEEYGGRCNLRMDDTNPVKEDAVYVEAMKADVRWLGFDFGESVRYASDYFEQMYEYALALIREGKAYVDDLSAEEIREHRGTLTQPGQDSPYRTRTVEENLDLFARMRAGEFRDGEKVLRAKIDMRSPNLNLRDPVMYRIAHAHHHRTGDQWCIYPMYDWAHGLEDSIEGVTHSFCTIEFENHRPLYDWFLNQLPIHHPRQIEFAPLALTYTVLSKRRLRRLVEEGHVEGWDDPRMPTLAGMRRRGYTPTAVRSFLKEVGVAKTVSVVDIALLEHVLRDDLNLRARRRMVVLRPLRLVIDNYPENQVEHFTAEENPEDESAGTREVPFSRELYIEQDDFMENPPKKYFRLAPGSEVRLKYAYYVTCTSVEHDAQGNPAVIHCSYDPESRGGGTPDGRRVKGTLHWASAAHAVDLCVHLYDHLYTVPDPLAESEGGDFVDYLNPNSRELVEGCKAEPAVAESDPNETYQFLRNGYFHLDPKDSSPSRPLFNRTVGLRDSWARIQRNVGGTL